MVLYEASMAQCWANRAGASRCHNRVPIDPEHVGLCDDHIAKFRDDGWVNEPERHLHRDGPQTPQGYEWARGLTA